MPLWADPKTLMAVYKHALPWELRRHLLWYREQGYPHIKQLEALIERSQKDKSAGVSNPQSALGSVSEDIGAPGDPELQGTIQEMGDEVLAGGA